MIKEVFIIGAPRSGTNILRNTLNKLDEFETWPCDEINHIWRHHNTRLPNDRFTERNATPRVKNYLRNKFKRFRFKKKKPVFLLEKTCANSLRIPFINEVFPDAYYIVIFRNGFETTSSATLRWKSNFDLKYTAKKARYIPLNDFPLLFLTFLKNRVKQFFSSEKKLDTWGPIYPGMEIDKIKYSVEEISAIQWMNCVNYALDDISKVKLDNNRIIYLSYQNFTAEPEKNIRKILKFLNVRTINDNHISECVKDVRINKKSTNEDKISSEIFQKIQNTNDRIRDFLCKDDLII